MQLLGCTKKPGFSEKAGLLMPSGRREVWKRKVPTIETLAADRHCCRSFPLGFGGMQSRGAALAAVVLAVASLCGCQLGEQTIVACPLTFSEQEKKILSVVPMGTPREAVVDKLSNAGIEGSFGERSAFFGVEQSVYYCDLWRRKDNKHWHIDVALLFDENGKLYKTRPANAITEVVHTNDQNAQNANRGATGDVGAGRRERSTQRVRQSRRQPNRDDSRSF